MGNRPAVKQCHPVTVERYFVRKRIKRDAILMKEIVQTNSFPNIATITVRKSAAILLLIIFLFNLVGYRILFDYAQKKSDAQVTTSLDTHQYNDADLITIKVPLSMPYQTVQSDFERIDGEINVSGKIYKYVKRRIVDGEMVLMCLPDHNKMRIEAAKGDFFKNTTDVEQNNASKKSTNSKSSFKNLISEYIQHSFNYSVAYFNATANSNALMESITLPSFPHTPPVPPPNAI